MVSPRDLTIAEQRDVIVCGDERTVPTEHHFPLRHKAPADPSETTRFVDRSAAPFGGGGENGASPGGQCLGSRRKVDTRSSEA